MKTAIVFYSKYGTTEGCASKLAKKFGDSTIIINIRDEKAPDVSDFGRIVIGSPVYVGKASKEVLRFCELNSEMLSGKSVGLFTCNILPLESQRLESLFPASVVSISRAITSFGGRIDFDKLTFPDRLVTRMLGKVDKSLPDFREGTVYSTISVDAIAGFVKKLQ